MIVFENKKPAPFFGIESRWFDNAHDSLFGAIAVYIAGAEAIDGIRQGPFVDGRVGSQHQEIQAVVDMLCREGLGVTGYPDRKQEEQKMLFHAIQEKGLRHCG